MNLQKQHDFPHSSIASVEIAYDEIFRYDAAKGFLKATHILNNGTIEIFSSEDAADAVVEADYLSGSGSIICSALKGVKPPLDSPAV